MTPARACGVDRTEPKTAPRKKNSSQKGANTAIEKTSAATIPGRSFREASDFIISSIPWVDALPNSFTARAAFSAPTTARQSPTPAPVTMDDTNLPANSGSSRWPFRRYLHRKNMAKPANGSSEANRIPTIKPGVSPKDGVEVVERSPVTRAPITTTITRKIVRPIAAMNARMPSRIIRIRIDPGAEGFSGSGIVSAVVFSKGSID